jgi:hypothetical protein
VSEVPPPSLRNTMMFGISRGQALRPYDIDSAVKILGPEGGAEIALQAVYNLLLRFVDLFVGEGALG